MAPPTFRIDIEKAIGTEFWSNSYLTDDPTLADAITTANDFVARERTITDNSVLFTKARVSDVAPGGIFVTVVLGLLGQRIEPEELLPLFNVVRVDFSGGAGRPSRKYLRGILNTGDVIAGYQMTAVIRDAIQADYADLMTADLNYVDPQGDELDDSAVQQLIGMRQLRRGSKRGPII